MSRSAEGDYQRFDMIAVHSSWVDAIGYDPQARALYVRFSKSGVVCRYLGVPPELYEDFMNAPSKGKWIHAHAMGWNYTIVSG